MFSVPISAAIVFLLNLLGVKLTAAQSLALGTAIVVVIKIGIALVAVFFGPKAWNRLMGKKDAPAVAAAPDAVAPDPAKPAE